MDYTVFFDTASIMLIEIIIFKAMIEVHGEDTLYQSLMLLGELEEWKQQFPTKASAGWHVKEDCTQVHYFKRDALPLLVKFFYSIIKEPLLIRAACDGEETPLLEFEEWELPPNQESAISLGYMYANEDYQFVVPYYYRHAFGAFRECPPII